MPRFTRPAALPDTAVAAVRQYFGLSQQEIAQWLGVTPAQASHLETGQRTLSPAATEALAPLVAVLPPAGAVPAPALRLASTAPALALGIPAASPLAARLNHCRQHARRLRQALRPLEAKAATAARWARALPTLRAALLPDPGPEAQPDPATDWPAWLNWRRHRWLAQRPSALPPARSARYHLLRLQAEALDAEAAALAVLLGQ